MDSRIALQVKAIQFLSTAKDIANPWALCPRHTSQLLCSITDLEEQPDVLTVP